VSSLLLAGHPARRPNDELSCSAMPVRLCPDEFCGLCAFDGGIWCSTTPPKWFWMQVVLDAVGLTECGIR
jgi:hypothetical protein